MEELLASKENLALLVDLRTRIENISIPQDAARESHRKYLHETEDRAGADGPREIILTHLVALIRHLCQAWKLQLQYFNRLLFVVAEATKSQPLLRILFAVQPKASNLPCKSILHLAISVIADQSDDCEDLHKSCLRLIANCCADNDINRCFVLEHNIMQSLVSLAIRKIEIDTLVPTIYNICNNYQDPVPDTSRQDGNEIAETDTNDDRLVAAETISYAIQKLVLAAPTTSATFQILLTLVPHCMGDRLGLLAELVEMSTRSVHSAIDGNGSAEVSALHWRFDVGGCNFDTLEALEVLAEFDSECRVYVIQASLQVLSANHACTSLLNQDSSSIWRLIRLASSEKGANPDDAEDFGEELVECRKQFLKFFYGLVSMPEFTSAFWASTTLPIECVSALSAYLCGQRSQENQYEEAQHQTFLICSMIMLAQLVSLEPVREQMLHHETLIQSLHKLLALDENDVLYPSVTVIGRLSLTPQSSIPFMHLPILRQMQSLLAGQGRGLILPFETVHALRVMIRNRAQYLPLYVSDPSSNESDIVSAVLVLFDQTIEAGTKLEVGHFVIDILRTIFPSNKDQSSEATNTNTTFSGSLTRILNAHATKFAEVLTFVCTQAEPAHQRVHGWFGLGMLSVWAQGRTGIIRLVDNDGLAAAIMDVSILSDGPAPRNLKVMLSKMQECFQNELPASVARTFSDAGQNLGLQLKFQIC